MRSLKDATITELNSIKGTSQKLHKRPFIRFVKAGELEGQTANQQGATISALYSSIVQIQGPVPNHKPRICGYCGIQVRDNDMNHLYSTIHQVASSPKPTLQPLAPLPFDESSSGYQYLTKYGWSPKSRLGLGAKGREGSREPVRAKVKLDKAGVGQALSGDKVCKIPHKQQKRQDLTGKQVRQLEQRKKDERAQLMLSFR